MFLSIEPEWTVNGGIEERPLCRFRLSIEPSWNVNGHLRLIHDRRVRYVSLGFRLSRTEFRRPTPALRALLAAYEQQVMGCFARASLEGGRVPSIEELRCAIHGCRPGRNHRFIDRAYEELESRAPTLTLQSYKTYKKVIRALETFDPRVRLGELSPAYARLFVRFLREKRQLSDGTVARYIRFASTVVRWMSAEVDENPFQAIYREVPKPVSQRKYLTNEEVARLEEYFKLHPEDHDARWTLFTIYTGLRYQDVADLRWGNIHSDGWIRLRQRKTGELLSIPIHSRIERVLPERGNDSERVWRIPSNQKANPRLRRLLRRAGIHRHITFHELRHTFAILSLWLGIPIEVVSKLLGHKDIRTTQIYARVYDDLKAREMRKWERWRRDED